MDENEALDHAAARELEEETSVKPSDVLLEQAQLHFDRVYHDSRFHFPIKSQAPEGDSRRSSELSETPEETQGDGR